MIVTIGGWLYIATAFLALVQLRTIHPTGEKVAVLASIAFLAVVGVGLLSRRNWARWLTLGMALVTSVGGSLVFLWRLAQLLKIFSHSSNLPSVVVAIVLVIGALIATLLWFNFKLFVHLASEEGREQFNTPETERHAVAKSTAVYIAWCVLSAFPFQPGVSGHSSKVDMAEMLDDVDRSRRERPSRGIGDDAVDRAAEVRRALEARRAYEARRQEVESQVARELEQSARAAEREARARSDSLLRSAEREEALYRQSVARANQANAQEQFRRKSRELFERRVRDRSYTDARFDAEQKALQRELQRSMESTAPGTAPGASRHAGTSGERPSSAVLKCRDASGAISYTQAYCPAGTVVVVSPPAD